MQTDSLTLSSASFADSIRDAHRTAMQHGNRSYQELRSAAHAALECGRLLNAQKALLRHSEWLPWCATQVPEIGERTVQRYMRLWTEYHALHPNATDVTDLPSELPTLRALYLEFGILRPVEPREAPSGVQSFLAPVYRLLGSKEFRGLVATDPGRLAADQRDMLKASLKPVVDLYAKL